MMQELRRSLVEKILKEMFLPYGFADISRVIELLPPENRDKIDDMDIVKGFDSDSLDQIFVELKI